MAYIRTIDISAPVERVWAAWTQGDAMQNWLAPRAFVEFHEGGSYEFFWDEDPATDSTLGCKLLSIDAPRSLRFEWQGKTSFIAMFSPPYGPTSIDVRLSPSAIGTQVVLEQVETRALPNWADYDAWMGAAWEMALHSLQAYCEGTPRPYWLGP